MIINFKQVYNLSIKHINRNIYFFKKDKIPKNGFCRYLFMGIFTVYTIFVTKLIQNRSKVLVSDYEREIN